MCGDDSLLIKKTNGIVTLNSKFRLASKMDVAQELVNNAHPFRPYLHDDVHGQE